MTAAPTPTGGAETLIDLRQGDAADPLNASIYLGSPKAIAGAMSPPQIRSFIRKCFNWETS